MFRRTLRCLLVAAACLGAPPAAGQDVSPHCPSANMLGGNILSNVCWRCIFPMKMAGLTMFGTGISDGGTSAQGFALSTRPRVPGESSNKVGCLCFDGPTPHMGVPLGMWMPTTLYENTLVPGCSPTLEGTIIGISDPLYLGVSGDPTSDLEEQSFVHVHTFSYPMLMMMELFTRCQTGFQDIDMLYVSEIDPMWNDPTVAMYGNPISVFGASLPATAACAADAIASSAHEPIDELFWCGGSWTTTLTPLTGFQHAQGPVQYSSSANLRLLAMNHLRGFERSTVGSDALCEQRYDAMANRSHYRWQVAWPRAEARRNHGSGESLMRWGYSRTIPGVADVPIYLKWKWIECCAPLIGN